MRRDFYRGSQDSLADRMEERRSAGTSLFRGEMWTDLLELRHMYWHRCNPWPWEVLNCSIILGYKQLGENCNVLWALFVL